MGDDEGYNLFVLDGCVLWLQEVFSSYECSFGDGTFNESAWISSNDEIVSHGLRSFFELEVRTAYPSNSECMTVW